MKEPHKNQELFVFVLVAVLSISMLFSVAASARVSTLVDRSSAHAFETEEFIASIDDLIAIIDSTKTIEAKALSTRLRAFEESAHKALIEMATVSSIRTKFKLLSPVSEPYTLTHQLSELRSQLRAELLELRRLESLKISSLLSEWHGEAFLLSLFVALIQLLSILALALCILLQRRLQAQRTAAQKAATNLAQLVEYSHESIFSVDRNCRIASWNPASERMFACSAAAAIGKSLRDWIRKESDAQICESLVQSGGQSAALEIEMRRRNAKHFWASISISPIASSGSASGATIVVSDITEQVNLRTQQADFVASLTHDLKNPMIANNLALKELVDRPGAGQEKAEQIAQKVITANEQMIDMLTAMLDLYRVNAGKFSVTRMPVIVPRLISDCVEWFQQRADMNCLTIEPIVQCHARRYRTDPLIVKKIILNLLDNALKFAPHGSVIRISAHDQDNDLIIAVEDNGPGITDARLGELFCISSPQSASDRKGQSSGLGLYLVKQLCLLIDAEISYKRLESGVSRFELRLLNSCDGGPARSEANQVTLENERDSTAVCIRGDRDER